jgi:hypothetical protein
MPELFPEDGRSRNRPMKTPRSTLDILDTEKDKDCGYYNSLKTPEFLRNLNLLTITFIYPYLYIFFRGVDQQALSGNWISTNPPIQSFWDLC